MIDTRSKRASAACILACWIVSPILPDATLDQGDRQHATWVYSGVLAEEFVPPPPAEPEAQPLAVVYLPRGTQGFRVVT